jgi:8-oxo-dGTP pyrophosphatase MutT (NUDIX family)
MNKYRNPIQVSVYPFRITNKVEFLLMRRAPHRDGIWQGVSGAVEIGEDVNVAAKRELKEETGFEAPVQDISHCFYYPIEESYWHLYAPDVNQIVDHAFIANVTNLGDPVLSKEHDDFKWLEFTQINLEDLKWAGNKAGLVKANEFINKLFTP